MRKALLSCFFALFPLVGASAAEVTCYGQVSSASFKNLVDVEKYLAEFRERFSYHRIAPQKDILWKGPSAPSFLVSQPPYDQHLTAAYLKEARKEGWIDSALQVLILNYIQISIEQGRRLLFHDAMFSQFLGALVRAKAAMDREDLGGTREIFANQLAPFIDGLNIDAVKRLRPSQVIRENRSDTQWELEWPQSGRPLPEAQLVRVFREVTKQAYRITPKDPSKELDLELDSFFDRLLSRGIIYGTHLEFFTDAGITEITNFRTHLGYVRSVLDLPESGAGLLKTFLPSIENAIEAFRKVHNIPDTSD